jgi:hypothetical protein
MNTRRLSVGFVAVAALAGSLYAAGLSSAAGVTAAKTVSRIVNCRIDANPVEQGIQIYTSAKGVKIGTGNPSSPSTLLSFKSGEKGYTVSSSACGHTRKRSPLGPGTFPSTHASPVDCASPAHVILRLRLTVDGSGYPTSAKLEVTQGRWNFKPLGYVAWATGGATTYYRSQACAVRN